MVSPGTRARVHAWLEFLHAGRHFRGLDPGLLPSARRTDKLTSNFQQALADAQSLAVGRDQNVIEPSHVLVALLDQQGGSTRHLLGQAGVNVAALLGELVAQV